MSWVPLYIPDFILAPSFGYLLFVLSITNVHSLCTPFFTFFVVTGICGLSTVVTHILMNRVSWPADLAWIPDCLLLINQSAMMAATFGKLFIALHRYFVLKTVAVNEKVWSVTLVRCLIFIQLSVPSLITGICFSFGYVVQAVANGTVSYNVAAQGQIIQKCINNAITIAYVLVTVILTHLSSRKLDQLRVQLVGQSKRAMLGHQKNMFIVVAVCSLSHILKAGQQSLLVIYSLNGKIDRSVYESLLWPTFVATNGFATYAPPLILVYCSPKIRRLLFGGIKGVRNVASTEQTVNTTVSSRRSTLVTVTQNMYHILLLALLFVTASNAASSDGCPETVNEQLRQMNEKSCEVCNEMIKGADYMNRCREKCYSNDTMRDCFKLLNPTGKTTKPN